jgi:hypothetical protein
MPFFVGVSLAPPLHVLCQCQVSVKLRSAKEMTVTPLMLMTLISLAPFPILFITLLAGRWLKPTCHAGCAIPHASNKQDGPYR